MTVWVEADDWTYEYFDINEPSSTFGDAEEFVELWRKKKGERPFPSKGDYDWYDLQPWWGRIGISAYFFTPFDYEYSLFGTEMVKLYQFDATGRRGSTFTDNEYASGGDLDFYQMVAENGHIARASGNIHWQNRKHIRITLVILPISESGLPVTHSIELMLVHSEPDE